MEASAAIRHLCVAFPGVGCKLTLRNNLAVNLAYNNDGRAGIGQKEDTYVCIYITWLCVCLSYTRTLVITVLSAPVMDTRDSYTQTHTHSLSLSRSLPIHVEVLNDMFHRVLLFTMRDTAPSARNNPQSSFFQRFV